MEMQDEFRTDQAGVSHVNMELDNAKEISLNHVLSKNTISIPKDFP
jgi:hypothetical protein